MNKHFRRQSPGFKLFLSLFSTFFLITGFVFATTAQPALASSAAQAATATATATVVGTATPAGTTTAVVTFTPTAPGTTTAVATLPAPAVSGTPTALVPVTGADLNPPGGQSGNILRIALGLLGLLLIGLGFRSYRLSKK